MKLVITFETLGSFAYSNDRLLKCSPRGIVFSFMGLDCSTMYAEDPDIARKNAENGLIFLIPYLDPWTWMNDLSVRYCDELIDVLISAYGLPEKIPVISTGGSMGGHAALVYACKAKRTPKAVVANCPVCDLPYHYTERPDLPRTLYAAYGDAPFPALQDALQASSPVHMALQGKMPEIPYVLFHCAEDFAVNREKHTLRFIEALGSGATVTYHEVPDRGHCDLDPEIRMLYEEYPIRFVCGGTAPFPVGPFRD